jgi:hypothetical protein
VSEVVSEGAPQGEMTFDQAAAAIGEAAKSDPEFNPNAPAEPLPVETPAEAPAPDQAATPPTPTEAPTPGADEFASEATEDSFMGGDFNPDLLPDELKPGFKQLQAEWTRKTQTLAEQRKALEALGSEEELKTAAEFYQSLQDPEYLKSFYGELGNVVRELGLVEDPAAPAPAADEAPAPAELPAELQQLVSSDPELAPLLERFTGMESRLKEFEQAQAQERQALEEERQLMTQAAEIDRMVQVVREEHPDYGDEDWQAIYDRAVAFDGNVLQAAELYAADQDRIVQAYLSRKPVPQAVTPTPGAATVTEDQGDGEPMTLDQANKAAQAYLDANDLAEFTG